MKKLISIPYIVSGLVVGLLGSDNLNLSILDSKEMVYNGESYTHKNYIDEEGTVLGKVFDKNDKEINLLQLKPKNKSLFSDILKDMLKAEPGELSYVPDDEVLEVLIALKHENIKLVLEPSIMEVSTDLNGEKEIKFNGKKIDKIALKKKQDEDIIKHDKAKKNREDNMKKKIDTFAKRNKLEKNKSIKEAYKNARSSFTLKLKKSDIEGFASKNEDMIVAIELASKSVNQIFDAMISTNVNPHALYSTSEEGNGIGIYMSEGSCPDTNHIINYTRLSGLTSSHSENVSAIIRAVSPDSYIYCKDGYTLPASGDLDGTGGNPRVFIESYSFANYVLVNGIKYVSRSYTIADRDFDNHVYDNDIAVFVAAGNNDSDLSGINVTSPGKALNAITVGNYDDAAIPEIIHSSSRYSDSEIENEKPELSAPGTAIYAGGHQMTGTSMATPHAAAFAADLMSSYSWLEFKPHLLKAHMLAGATKSISGGIDKVGIGGIDYARAYYNQIHKYWEGSNSSFYDYAHSDGLINPYIDWNINLTSGKKTRIAISWLNRGSYMYSILRIIGMDFDLRVFDPNGNLVADSSSLDNPYEVVDFIAPSTGIYKVQIARARNYDSSSMLRLGAVVTWQ